MNKYISRLLLITLPVLCFSTIAFDNNLPKPLIEMTQKNQTMININQASTEDLSSLKGIGVKKAEAINQYRLINGEFKDIDELMNVKGIGKQIVDDNKARIKV